MKFDWQVLRGAGVELAGVTWDSMVAGFLLDSGRRSYGIDVLSLEYLGRAMQTYGDVAGRGKGEIPFAEVPVAAAAAYCGNDSATVLALHAAFAPALAGTPMGGVLENVEMPLVPVLVDMEWAGVQIDLALFKRLSNELARDLEQLQVEIAQVAGENLNLNSPRQLATVLFDKHQLPVLKKTKTGPSTDADVLEQLADMGHDLPRLILSYRELQKLKSTYVDTLPLEVNPLTGRIHTSFNQTGAATGRLSSSDPNLQNIPVRTPRGEAIRRGFVPAEGNRFVVADYSQIELRIMAHLSGDPAFIEAFQQGGDIHRQTAALIFGVPVETGERGAARARQDDQLRDDLRAGPVRAVQAARHHAGRGEAVHRAVLRALRRRARLPRPAGRAGPGAGLRGDAASAAAGTSPRCGRQNFNLRASASATRRTRRSRDRPPT